MSKRIVYIALGLMVLLGVGGFVYWNQVSTAKAAAAVTVQTATVTRGTLVASVSGAGNIYAPQQTNLNFQLSGVPITKINVQVGDKVKSGDVLAQADDSDLQFAVRSAQAQLESAQASLAKLQQPPLQADVTAAQSTLASAQSAYSVAVTKNAHVSDTIASAKAALDNAAAAVQQAQTAYDRIGGASNPRIGMTSQALTLQQDTNNYQSALAAYNLALTDVNDSTVLAAAQQVASAQDALVKLTQPATPQDLAIAQASVDSAQVNVDQATSKLDQAKIIAPFDGTIAAVNYVIGQLSPSASTTPIVSLVNLDNLQIQVSLSEVDIAKVKPNDQVSLTFDALSGQRFQGKIVSVSPVGTVTQGVVNYTVTVAVNKSNASVMPGMTAEASVTVDQRANALMVPNRAVKTQGNQHLITELFEGKQIPVVVQTGLTNDQNTEIVSAATLDGQTVNLQDGDTIVLNPTLTTGGNVRGAGGGNVLGALGGFGR